MSSFVDINLVKRMLEVGFMKTCKVRLGWKSKNGILILQGPKLSTLSRRPCIPECSWKRLGEPKMLALGTVLQLAYPHQTQCSLYTKAIIRVRKLFIHCEGTFFKWNSVACFVGRGLINNAEIVLISKLKTMKKSCSALMDLWFSSKGNNWDKKPAWI